MAGSIDPGPGSASEDELAVRTGPVRVRLTGRDGVGKRTLAAALGRRGLRVDPPGGPPAADVHLYCFAGGLRAADRAALDRLRTGPRPVIAVRCRADLAGSWRAADARAEAASRAAGVPVLPAMAILDTRPDPGAFADLRSVAEAGLRIDDDVEPLTERLGPRAHLLDLLGGYGLGCAVGALRRTPGLPDATLAARLAELSGVAEIVAAIAAACAVPADRLAAIRAAELDRRLRRLLIDDPGRRDRVEARLLELAAGPIR